MKKEGCIKTLKKKKQPLKKKNNTSRLETFPQATYLMQRSCRYQQFLDDSQDKIKETKNFNIIGKSKKCSKKVRPKINIYSKVDSLFNKIHCKNFSDEQFCKQKIDPTNSVRKGKKQDQNSNILNRKKKQKQLSKTNSRIHSIDYNIQKYSKSRDLMKKLQFTLYQKSDKSQLKKSKKKQALKSNKLLQKKNLKQFKIFSQGSYDTNQSVVEQIRVNKSQEQLDNYSFHCPNFDSDSSTISQKDSFSFDQFKEKSNKFIQ